MKTKYNISNISNIFNSKGYILLSKEYINPHIKLTFKDKYGYYYTQPFKDFQNEHTPPKFHKSNLYTIQNIKLWINLNNKQFDLIR